MFLCSISTKGTLGLLDSFILNLLVCRHQHHHFSDGVWNVPSQHHPSVNSRLIYKTSIYGSYFKVHPLRFWYRGALLLENGGGGGKDQKNKNKSLFLSSDNPLQSRGCQKLNLQDKGGESTADKLQLSLDRWMINKRQQLKRKRTPCKLRYDVWQDVHYF